MVESMVGLYALICWLVFVKYKIVPVTTYTVCTAIFIGGVGMFLLYIALSIFHPVSHDARMYAPVVQIVPEVRGVVIEVPVEANKPMKRGDVLFRIEPRPFQIEVERLSASLAGKNRNFSLDVEELARAEAATKQARAHLLASESTNDRQLRESYEQAKALHLQVKERVEFAQQSFDRAKEGHAKGVISQQEYDRIKAQLDTQQAALVQAEAGEKIAAEELKRGSASLEQSRQELAEAEAKERIARTKVNTLIASKDKNGKDMVTPEEREVMAQLDKARWDLDQTVVRAPTGGYVPQVVLRPGTMSTATRLVPLMMFVADEQPTLIATFPQKVISDFKPGMPGEAVFKQYPGRTFKVKVRRVLTALREGELDASGQILSPTPATAPGYIPVVFDYDESIAGLNLPVGAQASIAIYTDRLHALSILRKIILRIHSWENYVF